MAVALEVTVNGSAETSGRYLTWTPSTAAVRVLDADGLPGPIMATLRTAPAGTGGILAFRFQRTDPGADHIDLPLPVDGTAVPFLLSGEFGAPSKADGDAVLEVVAAVDGTVLATVPFMVRIRRDANLLSSGERERFLSALARLNDQGRGRYQSFRDAHLESTKLEAHGNAGFPPWHRAYILDLERELQRIDPSVTLPYWRFDQPAPRLFTRDFIGANDPFGQVDLLPSNPLRFWSTDGQLGIVRRASFDTRTEAAHTAAGAFVQPEIDFVKDPNSYGALIGLFEQDPHGRAHVSFGGGFIRVIDTAARDPLFFLLHCNVDRLWAKWQWFNRRFDSQDASSYPFPDDATSPGATRIGHNAGDTMWPWNNNAVPPRPPTAPRTPFASSLLTAGPGPQPTVASMIDYQGHGGGPDLGFDYDDVPYEPEPGQ